MQKDGRQPQTFRLTIRRYTPTNKWFSRESRQCPIPSHLGQKILSGGPALQKDSVINVVLLFWNPFEGETSIFTRKLEVWFEKVFGISLKDTKQRDPWIAQIYKWVLRMSIFKIKVVTRTTVTHTNTESWMWPETLGCFPSWTFQSAVISEQR